MYIILMHASYAKRKWPYLSFNFPYFNEVYIANNNAGLIIEFPLSPTNVLCRDVMMIIGAPKKLKHLIFLTNNIYFINKYYNQINQNISFLVIKLKFQVYKTCKPILIIIKNKINIFLIY